MSKEEKAIPMFTEDTLPELLSTGLSNIDAATFYFIMLKRVNSGLSSDEFRHKLVTRDAEKDLTKILNYFRRNNYTFTAIEASVNWLLVLRKNDEAIADACVIININENVLTMKMKLVV
jgi:hypothetical protein